MSEVESSKEEPAKEKGQGCVRGSESVEVMDPSFSVVSSTCYIRSVARASPCGLASAKANSSNTRQCCILAAEG